MANGFYLMHRGWMDHPAFAKQDFTEREAFEWLISEATWADGRTLSINRNPVLLKKGQLSHSVRFMSQAWGWSLGKTQRFLVHLKKWSIIDTQTDTGQLIVTICNYDKYQNGDTQTDTATDTGPIQDRYRTDTKKNKDNKDNKDNLLPPFIPPDLFQENSRPLASAHAAPVEKQKNGKTLERWLADDSGMPPNEDIPDEWLFWARKEFPELTENEIIDEGLKARDWARNSGKTGKDWNAFWRNWIRKSAPEITQQRQRRLNYGNKR